MAGLTTLNDVLEATAKLPRAVLLGNGFSIAQSGGQFGYGSLLEHSGLAGDAPVRQLFEMLQTVDFEEVMHALEAAALVESAYADQRRSEQFRVDAGVIRDALIHAVRTVHPGIQFEIPEDDMAACADFLGKFQQVFTLNYDLLLYWVILNAPNNKHNDGFGLGAQIGGFRTFSEQAYCSVYYLHGALHLFLNDELETQKRISAGGIIDAIARSIKKRKQLPLFVAEGTSIQKASKIHSIPYLRHCYEQLSTIQGSLFVFGHSASGVDHHIYDAIFESRITIFVCFVHDPKNQLNAVAEKFAPYQVRREDVAFYYVDASSANVWGHTA